MTEIKTMNTYDDFVKEYGERPPDIVFAVTRQAVAEEIINEIEGMNMAGVGNSVLIARGILLRTLKYKYLEEAK